MIPLTFTHVVNLINECFKDKKDVCVCVWIHESQRASRQKIENGGRSLPTYRISIECKELSVVSGTLHGADGLIRVYRTREYRTCIKIYTTVSENENRSCKNINRFVSVTVKQKLYIHSNSEIATFYD